MKSILEEFSYGNITPETPFFERNSEYGKALTTVADNEAVLLNRLGPDDKSLFEELVAALGEMNRIAATDNFIYGYKLGVLMTTEVFMTSDNIIGGA